MATVASCPPGERKKNVESIADRIKIVSEQLAESLGSEQGGGNMKAILENLAQATDALNKTVRENRDVLHDTLVHVDSITRNSERP